MNYNKPKNMININDIYNKYNNSYIISQEKRENYKKILDQQLFECFDEKYVIYKSELKDHFQYDEDGSSSLSNVVLDFYFSDLTRENNEQYKTEFTFKYYILIKESVYKKFKNMDKYLSVCYLNYDINYPSNHTTTISQLAKFLKPSYNKETITMDGIRYIKIKLRSLTNTFLLVCSFVFDLKYKNWGDDNSIKIMTIPIREKYINFISFISISEPVRETFIMDINSSFTIKVNVLGMYKKILEKYIETIKNKEKIFLNKTKYTVIPLQGNLINNKTESSQNIIFHLYVSYEKMENILIDLYADKIDFRWKN